LVKIKSVRNARPEKFSKKCEFGQNRDSIKINEVSTKPEVSTK
jgi:hypothetical protein